MATVADPVGTGDPAGRAESPGPESPGTVLVTGAGEAAGIAVVRALAGRYRVVATDSDPAAVGLLLADTAEVLPPGGHLDRPRRVAELAARTGATALVCTVPEEIPALVDAADRLAAAGLRTWLPAPRAVTRCIDKWAFAQTCAAAGIPTPATALGADWVRCPARVPGPWIVKPRYGRGSRDVHRADSARQVRQALDLVPEPIVQNRLSGPEFTVDALVDRSGRPAGVVARWRLETDGGISTRGRTFTAPALGCAVAHLLGAFGLDGQANVQGFRTGPEAYTFTDVNPCFAAGLALSLAAGADFIGEYLRGVAGLPPRPQRLVARPGVTMVRHLTEVFAE